MLSTLAITRVVAAPKAGSSRPIVAATTNGQYIVKLRGAAQGTGVLVAEIIVSALARALELPVLSPRLVTLAPGTPTDNREDELADLLTGSIGLNLAFPLLEQARNATQSDFVKLSPAQRAATLWLDRFVLNPDRTIRNSNMLVHKGKIYLIDHGSALRFQYDWGKVTEATPREVGTSTDHHVFEKYAETDQWSDWDQQFASCITRKILEKAVTAVPENFLIPLLTDTHNDSGSLADAIRRRRAAYVAFLWKRLKAPRLFASESPERPPANIAGMYKAGQTLSR